MPEVQFTDDPPRWLLSSLRAQPTTNLAAVDLAIAALGVLWRAQRCAKDATGGSTGPPTEAWLGPEELGWHPVGDRLRHGHPDSASV